MISLLWRARILSIRVCKNEKPHRRQNFVLVPATYASVAIVAYQSASSFPKVPIFDVYVALREYEARARHQAFGRVCKNLSCIAEGGQTQWGQVMTPALRVHNRLKQESRRVVLINATILKYLYHICRE